MKCKSISGLFNARFILIIIKLTFVNSPYQSNTHKPQHRSNRASSCPLWANQLTYCRIYGSSFRPRFVKQYDFSLEDIALFSHPQSPLQLHLNMTKSTSKETVSPWVLKSMLMYLPNLDELSLRTVLAFPKASKMGLASKICCSIQECCPLVEAKYCKISLVLSVLPAPDSPLEFHCFVLFHYFQFL